MVKNCLECSELMYDGFSYFCMCKGCPIWKTDLAPIVPSDEDHLPDIDIYDEVEDEDVFLSV